MSALLPHASPGCLLQTLGLQCTRLSLCPSIGLAPLILPLFSKHFSLVAMTALADVCGNYWNIAPCNEDFLTTPDMLPDKISTVHFVHRGALEMHNCFIVLHYLKVAFHICLWAA